MISRPDSIAWIIGIFLVVAITIGLAVTDSTERMSATDPINQLYFTNAYSKAENQTGIAGAGVDATKSLSGSEGTDRATNEESILTAGFKSMLDLGKTWNAAKQTMTDTTSILGIDPIYWTIAISLTAVSFGIIVYTWIRGR